MIMHRSSRGIGRRAASFVAALMLLLVPLTTAPARASNTTPAAAVVNEWVDPPVGCRKVWTFEKWNHTGRFPCSTRILWVIWPDDHEEYFGIGTNWEVYRITAATDGWRSMGGKATDPYQAYINADGHATIAVINEDAASHKVWCKQYIYPNWVGWYACGPK